MRRQVQIIFNAETTAQIAKASNNPAFAASVFEDVINTSSHSGLFLVAVSDDRSVDGVAEYFYNLNNINRIRIIDLPDEAV